MRPEPRWRLVWVPFSPWAAGACDGNSPPVMQTEDETTSAKRPRNCRGSKCRHVRISEQEHTRETAAILFSIALRIGRIIQSTSCTRGERELFSLVMSAVAK